jgi:glucokinase
LNREEIAAIGVDVGGTKIAAGLVSARGEILARQREVIQKGRGDGLTPAKQIGAMVSNLRSAAGSEGLSVAGCGVAVPSFVNRASGEVRWAPNIDGWKDFPLGRLLQDWTGVPVALDYDGSAAVLGEQWVGAACGASDVAFIIVGTGVGAGFIFDGRVYRGASGLAGGIGWSCLESEAIGEPLLGAGGFLETVAAGPGIARRFCLQRSRAEKEGGAVDAPGAPGRRGADVTVAVDVTAEGVLSLASAENAVALSVTKDTVRYIGMAVANLISTLNPEVVVLGGGIGCHLGPYLDGIRDIVRQTAQPQSMKEARVVTSALGDDAGIVGSARSILDLVSQRRGDEPAG